MTRPNYIHAAVAVSEVLIQDGRIYGYASPQSSGPCLLRLSSNDMPISFTAATSYSPSAAKEGLRSGWCGFELYGLRDAIALGERVEITCAVSGRILKSVLLGAEDMPALHASSRSLSVEELLREVRQPHDCPQLDQLLPFATNHYRRHGPQSFRDMTYLTLLGRWPDTAASHPDNTIAEDEKRVLSFIENVIASPEFGSRWVGQLPGPYHPDFRYDTTGLM